MDESGNANRRLPDVSFAPTSPQRSSGRPLHPQQLSHPHPNSSVNTFASLSASGVLNSTEMSDGEERRIREEEEEEEEEEDARTVTYLERVGGLVTDDRTCGEKIRDETKRTCAKVREVRVLDLGLSCAEEECDLNFM